MSEAWAQLVSTTDPLSDPVQLSSDTFIIGRSKASHLSLTENQLISKKHCTIERDGSDGVFLIDSSTNGTLINMDKRVHRNKSALKHGDEIHLVFKKGNTSSNVAYLFQVLSVLEEEELNETLDISSDTVQDSQATVIDGGSDEEEKPVSTKEHLEDFKLSKPPSSTNKSQASAAGISSKATDKTKAKKTNDGTDKPKASADEKSKDSAKGGGSDEKDKSGSTKRHLEDLEDIDITAVTPYKLLKLSKPSSSTSKSQASAAGTSSKATDKSKTKKTDDGADKPKASADTKPKDSAKGENKGGGAGGSDDKSDKAEAGCSSKGNSDMEDTLMCVICQEVLHDCISLQPCMHSFCAGCYSDWMACSQECPTCRIKVDRISKNHLVNNLAAAFLAANPSKKRAPEEIAELDKKNKITRDMLYPKSLRTAHDPYDDDVYSDDEVDSGSGSPLSDSDDGLPLPVHTYNANGHTVQVGRTVQPASFFSTHTSPFAGTSHTLLTPIYRCRQCINYVPPIYPGTFGPTPPVPDIAAAVAGYKCIVGQVHMICQCCTQPMPNRTAERPTNPAIPPQQCTYCLKIYCHAYWGCRNVNCRGCLAKLKDMKLPANCLDNILLQNQHESNILKGYLQRKNITCDQLFETCLENHIAGNSLGATGDTYVCQACATNVFRDMAYKYRTTLDDEDLLLTKKPDCYWGKNCRTQRTNLLHAAKYNHICQQTRHS